MIEVRFVIKVFDLGDGATYDENVVLDWSIARDEMNRMMGPVVVDDLEWLMLEASPSPVVENSYDVVVYTHPQASVVDDGLW